MAKSGVFRIYYGQNGLAEGLKLYTKGRGYAPRLVRQMVEDGKPLKCWCCGLEPNSVTLMVVRNSDYEPKLVLTHTSGAAVEVFNADHIIPASMGGRNRLANFRLSCMTCNMDRGTTVSESDLKFLVEHKDLCKKGDVLYNKLTATRNPLCFVGTVQHYDPAHYVY